MSYYDTVSRYTETEQLYSDMMNSLYKVNDILSTLDHLLNINSVLRTYGSTETLNYLYGDSVELSTEGIFGAIGHGIKAVFQWLWNAIKAMFRWVGKLFGYRPADLKGVEELHKKIKDGLIETIAAGKDSQMANQTENALSKAAAVLYVPEGINSKSMSEWGDRYDEVSRDMDRVVNAWEQRKSTWHDIDDIMGYKPYISPNETPTQKLDRETSYYDVSDQTIAAYMHDLQEFIADFKFKFDINNTFGISRTTSPTNLSAHMVRAIDSAKAADTLEECAQVIQKRFIQKSEDRVKQIQALATRFEKEINEVSKEMSRLPGWNYEVEEKFVNIAKHDIANVLIPYMQAVKEVASTGEKFMYFCKRAFTEYHQLVERIRRSIEEHKDPDELIDEMMNSDKH